MPQSFSLLLRSCEGFEWDAANRDKIMNKHHLQPTEIEQVFFDHRVAVFEDLGHSVEESRYIVLGKTREDKLLFIACTVRNNKIRPISARPAKKEKEVQLYEKAA